MSDLLKFSIQLLISLLITLGVHLSVLNALELPLYEDQIVLAYVINYLLAVLIYGILYVLRNKMTAQLGFLYMGGSMLKFIFFFVLFYPAYKADGNLTTSEFAAFFLPYAISLVFETLGIIKFLKK